MLISDFTRALAFTWEAMFLLESTLRRITRKAALAPVEWELEPALEDAFRTQGELFVARLEELEPWFPKLQEAFVPANLSAAEIAAMWAEIAYATMYFFEAPMNAAALKAMLAGKASVLAELNWVGGFQLGFDEALLNQIPSLTKMTLNSINQTTQDYINTQVRHAMEEGWSYDRTAKAITDRFEEFAVGRPQLHIKSRAHLVAVTETGNMYVEGAVQTARAVQDMGLEVEKKWSTIGAERVCDDCNANAAVGWIPLNSLYPSGHMQPLAHPACRCDQYHRRAKK